MSCAEVLQASSQFFLENSTCPITDSCAVRSLCDYRISELDQMLGHACIALVKHCMPWYDHVCKWTIFGTLLAVRDVDCATTMVPGSFWQRISKVNSERLLNWIKCTHRQCCYCMVNRVQENAYAGNWLGAVNNIQSLFGE